MYFLKRNALNVIISVPVFGVIGTFISLVVPAHTYEYEEYYTIDGEVSSNTGSLINAALNNDVNAHFPEKAVNVNHDENSTMIRVDINVSNRDDIEAVKVQTENVISELGYVITDRIGANIYQIENNFLKIVIIALSLFIGLIIGLSLSLLSKKISTDEDFEYYLDEKTLGNF